VRYQGGFGRRAAVWVVGTAGVYGGLYGFAAGNRTFAVLGIVLAALAVVGGLLSAVLAARWSSHRRRVWLTGTGEVRTASPPPASEAFGRCDVALLIVVPGLPRSEKAVSRRLPVTAWPEPGDTVPVRVDIDDMRRVRVSWDQLHKARPSTPTVEDDQDDLAEAAPPPWERRPNDVDPPRPELDDDLDLVPLAAPRGTDDGDFAFVDLESDDDTFGYRANDDDGPGFSPDAGYAAEPEFQPPEEMYLTSRRFLPIEEEPSWHAGRYLFPTERFRGEWRRHWVRPLVRYTVTFAAAVGAQFLIPRFVPPAHVAGARIAVAVAGGLVALHVLFAFHLGRFVLTNRRVMLVEGVLRRRVSMAPLPRAADLRLEQSVAGRLFNYGDFVFERKSIFSRMRVVAALPNPNELYLRTVEEVYEPGAVEARLGRAD